MHCTARARNAGYPIYIYIYIYCTYIQNSHAIKQTNAMTTQSSLDEWPYLLVTWSGTSTWTLESESVNRINFMIHFQKLQLQNQNEWVQTLVSILTQLKCSFSLLIFRKESGSHSLRQFEKQVSVSFSDEIFHRKENPIFFKPSRQSQGQCGN